MRHTVETATETAFPPASGVRTVKIIIIIILCTCILATTMHILVEY